MDEMLGFFKELMKMTYIMLNDIMPDLLLHLDQGALETLMKESQEVNSSLVVFTKLCGMISRKNLSRTSLSLVPECPPREALSVVGVQPSQSPQASSVGDNKSVVSNFSDLSTHTDDVWKGLLTEARIWCITHKNVKPTVSYCGVCDKQAKANHVWKAHLGGKNHLRLLEDVDAVKFTCGDCDLRICGTVELVKKITSSEEHQALDALVCSSHLASPVPSVTSICSSKVASKTQEPEFSDTSEASKPSLPEPSSTNRSNASQKEKPTAQSTPKVSKVVFEKTEIHSAFVNITDIVAGRIENHEPFEIAYCRPCEIICESKKLWLDHKKTGKHRGKMSSKHFNNFLCRCLQCEFVVTASWKIATTYMKYHIEKCHRQSTEGIKIDEYMELKNLALSSKTEKSEPDDHFKGSSETINSVTDLRCSSADLRNSLPELRVSSSDLRFRLNVEGPGVKAPAPDAPRVVDRDALLESSSSASSSRSSRATERTSDNPYKFSRFRPSSDQVSDRDPPAQINHSTQNDTFGAPPALADCEFTFLQMLFRKEESFQKDTTFKLFTALCTLCNRANFNSQYAWSQHVLFHGQLNSAKEVACTQCHTLFFGQDVDIAPLIDHDYHVCIDAMFSW